MPNRMLSFRFENGRQIIRLVERSEIAEQIKFRISKEKWANLEVYESLELVKEHGKYAMLSHTWFRGAKLPQKVCSLCQRKDRVY